MTEEKAIEIIDGEFGFEEEDDSQRLTLINLLIQYGYDEEKLNLTEKIEEEIKMHLVIEYYKVVVGSNLYELERTINDEIKKGWQPLNTPFIVESDLGGKAFLKEMIKYKEDIIPLGSSDSYRREEE